MLFNLTISDLLRKKPPTADPNLFMDDLAVAVNHEHAYDVIAQVTREVKKIDCHLNYGPNKTAILNPFYSKPLRATKVPQV